MLSRMFSELYGGNYRKLLVVPAVFFLLFLIAIFVFPGIEQGLDLTGGTMIVVRSDTPIDSEKVNSLLSAQYPLQELQVTSISSPAGYGTVIQYSKNQDLFDAEERIDDANSLLISNSEQAKQLAIDAMNSLQKYTSPPSTVGLSAQETVDAAKETFIKAKESFDLSLQNQISKELGLGEEAKFQKTEIGPSLGESFWESSIWVAGIALLLVIIVIFIFFREIIPSLAVIAAAIFDISGALALMTVFGFPLTLASIPALLMLIGYSVDTDILLTTRLLKRKEKNAKERTIDSMKTGLTMTLTTLAALVSMLILSYFSQILIIFQIAAVLFFGLLADLISTWFMNAPILLWYVESKKREFE